MNLVINYDFFNAIKDVNENFTAFKIIRNNQKQWVRFNIPIVAGIEYLFLREDFISDLPSALFLHFSVFFGIEFINYTILGDIYKDIASYRLQLLVAQLNQINVKTNYNLLKKSVCYEKITNFRLNEYKLPQLIESKYVLVPSFNYNNELVDTSILQEHVIGSNEYILSVSLPRKVLKLAYAR